MFLDASIREHLCAEIRRQLEKAVSDSYTTLRGSLAEGRADMYSDIDLLWEVPDAAFADALRDLPRTIVQVRPLSSLRFDPDFQNSANRRLIFVRFQNVPLFWRLDLEIVAAFVPRDRQDNRQPLSTDWSWPESALMNAVTAVKVHLRGHGEETEPLLERAFLRLGLPLPAGSLSEQIFLLTEAAARTDPAASSLAAEVRDLAQWAFTDHCPDA